MLELNRSEMAASVEDELLDWELVFNTLTLICVDGKESVPVLSNLVPVSNIAVAVANDGTDESA